MRPKHTKKVAQMASKAASKARPAPVKPTSPPNKINLGRQIFVYNHLQTNQVVYSLTRSIKNVHALRQLPYNGKKTVPAALRKDLWAPLACIDFADPEDASSKPHQYGLRTFQKLREYRKLHETQWPKAFARDAKTGRVLTRIERGRRLCDQKANSVADMAAALEAVTLRRVPVKEDVVEEVVEDVVEDEVEVEGEGEVKRGKKEIARELREPLVRATVLWRDILDAEFAGSWPETVVHDRWETTTNNRKAPIVRTELHEEELVEAEAEPEPESLKDEAGKIVL